MRKIEGQIFNNLMVLEDVGWHSTPSKPKMSRLYKCLCRCGTEVVVRRDLLIRGKTKSCGCLRKETVAKNNAEYLKTRISNKLATINGVGIMDVVNGTKMYAKVYDKWRAMIRLCTNSQTHQVCDEWLFFSNFKRWFDETVVKYSDDTPLYLWQVLNHFSPSTCFLVTKDFSELLKIRKIKTDGMPIGVIFRNGSYISRLKIGGQYSYLGRFEDIEGAQKAYADGKIEHIKRHADKYWSEGKINKTIYDAIIGTI